MKEQEDLAREWEAKASSEGRRAQRLQAELEAETQRGKEADRELDVARSRLAEAARTQGAAAGAAQDEIERLRGELS